VRDVYRSLAAEGRLGSWIHSGFWWEFGSPELYLDGCLALLSQPAERLKVISAEHDGVREVEGARVALGPGAEFGDGVSFVGRAAIGYGSYVSEASRVEDSVVMPEAWIGPGSRLERCVVGQGVELPAGYQGRGELICLDTDPKRELPPSARRFAGLIVHSMTAVRAG
jgi:NDP-sugar pyrophosphorylase family protein